MNQPRWMKNIAEVLPAIEDLAAKRKERFQEKCFELLLQHALTVEAEEGPVVGITREGMSQRSLNFLRQNGIDPDDLALVMDLETGGVHIADIGKSNAESQRRLAALIATRHFVQDDEMRIPEGELRNLCETFNVYDPNNFRAYMRKAKHGKASIFSPAGDGWIVTAPGMSFVAETLKRLIEKVKPS